MVVWSYLFPHRSVSFISKSTFIVCRSVISLCYNLFTIFCMTTYVVILLTILKSRRSTRMDNNDEAKSMTMFQYVINYIKTKGYTTPFFITLTYIMFVNIPGILRMICIVNDCAARDLVMRLWAISFPFYNLSDVLIYVYFDKDIWKYLKKKFSK